MAIICMMLAVIIHHVVRFTIIIFPFVFFVAKSHQTQRPKSQKTNYDQRQNYVHDKANRRQNLKSPGKKVCNSIIYVFQKCKMKHNSVILHQSYKNADKNP